MRSKLVRLSAILAFVAATGYAPAAAPPAVPTLTGPSLQSLGPLTFAPDGTMFAADPIAATIFAVNLGAQANGGAPGTSDVTGLDAKIAAMLGSDVKEIAIADIKVHPKTRNTFVAIMRGQGPNARPALFRVDGAGKITVVPTESLQYTSVSLPNAPVNGETARGNQRAQSITQLAVTNGRVFVAGLSNEEFASKLWSVGYPFTKADIGTNVEIYHGNHERLETRAPVLAFVPYTLNGQPHLIAGYTCTPLVKFPITDLKPGEKYRGTTIAEFGAGNRPIDMIVYKKNGQDFLLMSNTSRGVMRIPTAPFAAAMPITAPVTTETGGVAFDRITTMTGVTQLDLLDATHSIVMANGNLSAVELP